MTLEVIGSPVLLANPASLDFRVAPGQSTPPTWIQVSGNTPGQAYEVNSTAPWLRARARTGRTPGMGSAFAADLVDVEVDTASLGPGVHQAALQVGAWRAANIVEVPVRVEVLATAPGPPMAGAMSSLPLDDPRLPRLAVGPSPVATVSAVHEAPHAPPVAGTASHGTDPHDAASSHAAPPPARKAAPSNATRLSRSTQLRSKYLASKQTPPAAPKDAHAKPSPVGEPVKKDAHAAAPAPKKDDHAAPKKDEAKKDAHAAPAAQKTDDHAAAKKDAHAAPAPKKDDHAAPKKDDHAKPKEQAKH